MGRSNCFGWPLRAVLMVCSTLGADVNTLIAPGAAEPIPSSQSPRTDVPFPVGPAATLPSLDGTAYPPYRVVFEPGECTSDDGATERLPNGKGTTLISLNKTCFSCFRIPTLLAGQTPGVLHAFAEGRRAELTGHFHQFSGPGMGGCPDGPDTRLVYKRSTNYGASWSKIAVILEGTATATGASRAENGQCQSQAAPVIDPTTHTLFVAFNANGPGCQARALGAPYEATPMLVNSSDEGLTWSAPYPLMLQAGPGHPPVPAGAASHFSIGPTKGLTLTRPDGGVRLQLPGEAEFSAAVASDDHGVTWQSNYANRSMTLSPGEMDWTMCPPGAQCPPGTRYIMVNRAGGRANPHSMGVQFSADGAVWGPQQPTDNGEVVAGLGHAKPGIVAVPGGFVSSQTLQLCPAGLKMNPDFSCGTRGTPGYVRRNASDVLGAGMCLMVSKDGVHWGLFKKTWPIGGMYTTAAGITFDNSGAALTFGVVFAAGALPIFKTGTIYYQNFTAVHPNGTMDNELAAAIRAL